MSLRDDETVRIPIAGDALRATEQVYAERVYIVVDGLYAKMHVAGTLTAADRERWADVWLVRQGDKPAWAWDVFPDGLTKEDIAAVQMRKLHRDQPNQVMEFRCDAHGRAACPSCNRPLHVTEYEATLKLLHQHQDTVGLLDTVVILGIGFASCGLFVFALWLAGLVLFGGAL